MKITHLGAKNCVTGSCYLIHTLTGYSAHADQNTLVTWVNSMPRPPKQIHLVHGEPSARKALARALGL